MLLVLQCRALKSPVVCVCPAVAATSTFAQGQHGGFFDALFPSTNAGADATTIPTYESNVFAFGVNSSTGLSQQPLQTYSRGFPAVGCNMNGIWNISFAQLYTPESLAFPDYADHLSSRVPYLNNITGTSRAVSMLPLRCVLRLIEFFEVPVAFQPFCHFLQAAATAQIRQCSR